MILWILILFLLFLLSKLNYNPIIYYTTILVLMILCGLREDFVGTDTQSYIQGFESTVKGNGWFIDKDQGFQYLSKIAIFFTTDAHVFLLIISFLTLGITSIAFKRESSNPQASLFIYYGMYAYLMSFNICRQYIAIALVLLAYTFLDKNKLIFIVIILLASTMHTSAIFVLFVLLIKYVKMNNRFFVYSSIFISFVLGLTNIVPILKYFTFYYMNHLEEGDANLYRDDAVLLFILSVGFSIFFLYLYEKSDYYLKNNSLFKIFYIGILMNNIMFQLGLGTRLVLYFTITQTLFLPYFFTKKYQYTKWIVSGYLLIYCIIMLLRGSANVYPYKSILLPYII